MIIIYCNILMKPDQLKNLLDSGENPLFQDVENLYITYAICHLASMTSAISNPILYGFMNENFREEFSKIWKRMKKKSCCFKNVEESNSKEKNGVRTMSGPERSGLVLKIEEPTI